MRKCSIEGCNNKHDAKGYCSAHYNRKKKYGDPLYFPPKKPERKCSIDGCDKKHTCKGFCKKHYERFLAHGDPLFTKLKVERHGMYGTKEHKAWSEMKFRCYNKKATSYPRYGALGIKVCDKWKDSFTAFFEDMGKCPEGYSLDRIDPKKGYSPRNCRWADVYTQAQNKKSETNSKSGIRGVYEIGNKWIVKISAFGENYDIGSFNDKESAIKARKEAEKKYWK